MVLKPKKLIQRSDSLQYLMSAFLNATDICNTIINRKKDVKILNQYVSKLFVRNNCVSLYLGYQQFYHHE